MISQVFLNANNTGYDKEFRNKMREIYDKFNEDSHKCTVLKKVIREVDPDTKEESLRVVYIFDDRQIKNFKKRVEKLQIKKVPLTFYFDRRKNQRKRTEITSE